MIVCIFEYVQLGWARDGRLALGDAAAHHVTSQHLAPADRLDHSREPARVLEEIAGWRPVRDPMHVSKDSAVHEKVDVLCQPRLEQQRLALVGELTNPLPLVLELAAEISIR